MTTRNPVTRFGGASNPSKPNGLYIGIIAVKFSNTSANITIPSLGNVIIGPCRAVDGLDLSVGGQVLCAYINGQLDEMMILGTLSGV